MIRPHTVRTLSNWAPLIGSVTSTAVTTGVRAGTAAGTSAAVSAAGGLATTAGAALSVAVPVAGVVIGAIIAGLFAAHAQRVKDAKAENQNLESLIPTVISAISAVFSAANQGQISASDAAAAMATIQQQYWQAVAAFENAPGQAGGPGSCPPCDYASWKAGSCAPVSSICNKSCTASCCIGCTVINQWVVRATNMFQTGGAPDNWAWGEVIGNKYGLTNYSAPNWSYTPPAGTNGGTSAIPSATQSLANSADSIISGAVSSFSLTSALIVAGLIFLLGRWL